MPKREKSQSSTPTEEKKSRLLDALPEDISNNMVRMFTLFIHSFMRHLILNYEEYFVITIESPSSNLDLLASVALGNITTFNDLLQTLVRLNNIMNTMLLRDLIYKKLIEGTITDDELLNLITRHAEMGNQAIGLLVSKTYIRLRPPTSTPQSANHTFPSTREEKIALAKEQYKYLAMIKNLFIHFFQKLGVPMRGIRQKVEKKS